MKQKMSSVLDHDKVVHSFYGTLLYYAISLFDPLIAIIVVVIVALLTEILDKKGSGNSEGLDFIFTIFFPVLFYIKEIF